MAKFIRTLGFDEAVVSDGSVTVDGVEYPEGSWNIQHAHWAERDAGLSWEIVTAEGAADMGPPGARAYLLPVVSFSWDYLVVWD